MRILVGASVLMGAVLVAVVARPAAQGQGRGGKGRELLQRGQFTKILWPTPEAPAPLGGSAAD